MLERTFAPSSVDLLFSDAALLAAMGRFEMNLAQAQAAAGLIPQQAADAIARACRDLGDPSAADGHPAHLEPLGFDIAKLHAAARTSGSLVLPFLRMLGAHVARFDAQAQRFMHLGCSDQDVLDTALAMQCKEATRRLLEPLERTGTLLAKMSDDHRRTMMLGRALLQPATAISFGWKLACWLDPMTRSRRHLRAALLDVSVLQLGGSAGIRAGMGPDAQSANSVAQRLADHLGLMLPTTSWQGTRDRFARLGTELALLCGALGKLGGDIALLMQAEVAEVFESASMGRGEDAPMPHKRDPVGALLMREAAVRAPGLASTMLVGMAGEHERGLGNWQSGWWTMRELFGACASALTAADEVLSGLQVDARRMQHNIDRMNGFVFAEAVTDALTTKIGREAAQALVGELCESALQKKMTLRQVLGRDSRVSGAMSLAELERLFDPAAQMGASETMIDQVIGAWHASR